MRVLQVHTRYRQRGGEDTVVDNERELLTRAGHDVRLFESSNPEQVVAATATLTKSPWNKRAAKDAVTAAVEFQADIVHVHNTWFAQSPAVFAELRKAGFPVVATVHNYRLSCVNAQFYRDRRVCEDCLGRFPWRGVTRACYRGSRIQSAAVAVTIGTGRAAKVWHEDVSAVVALTQFAATKFIASGIPPENIRVKPNTVADPGARETPPSAGAQVLFVGRLVEEKGILDLMEAWSLLREDGLELVVVGEGPLTETVDARAGESMTFVGGQDRREVAGRMLRARALVLPSRWYEGLPMVLLEAMAAGLPVVVPNHGAMAESAGGGALVFEATSVESLSEALAELRSDETVDTLGQRSRARYVESFSEEVGVELLLDLYRQVLATPTGRQS